MLVKMQLISFLNGFLSYKSIRSCLLKSTNAMASLCFQALLPTRRWFNTMLDDSHLVVSCQLSGLLKRETEGHLFCQVKQAFSDFENLFSPWRNPNWCYLFFSASRHAKVLLWFWDQWSDRKCSYAERNDHVALWQDHFSAGKQRLNQRSAEFLSALC